MQKEYVCGKCAANVLVKDTRRHRSKLASSWQKKTAAAVGKWVGAGHLCPGGCVVVVGESCASSGVGCALLGLCLLCLLLALFPFQPEPGLMPLSVGAKNQQHNNNQQLQTLLRERFISGEELLPRHEACHLNGQKSCL